MLASWRPTAKIRSSHSQEQHLSGGWRLAQAWEEQLYNCWWSVGQRFWACSPHGSPDLISAMLRTGHLIIQHCTKATILLMGAKSGSPHSAVLCGGDTPGEEQLHNMSSHAVYLLKASSSGSLGNEIAGKNKCLIVWVLQPARKQEFLCTTIKETLDPMWSIAPPNYYTPKDPKSC